MQHRSKIERFNVLADGTRVEVVPTDDLDSDPDIILYNFTIINSSGVNKEAFFEDKRDTPLINNPNNFLMAFDRLDVNGSGITLPVHQALIQTGQSNINLTKNSITMEAAVGFDIAGTVYQFTGASRQFIIWEPEVTDEIVAPIPPLPTTVQNLYGAYYMCYSYQHYVKLVNKAFVAALADIQTQFDAFVVGHGGAATPLTTKVPKMSFAAGSGLFSVICDKYGYGGDARTSKNDPTDDENFTFNFNNDMYGMYASFYFKNRGLDNGRAFEFQVYDDAGQNTVTIDGTGYYKMTQEFISTSVLWSPIQSIGFTSFSLPVVNELMGNPIRLGNSNLNPRNESNGFSNIITDISLPMNTGASDYRQFIKYDPSHLRPAAMVTTHKPIQSFDMRANYINRLDLQSYPILIPTNGTLSGKVGFYKKGKMALGM
jgi:hypothetical protein